MGILVGILIAIVLHFGIVVADGVLFGDDKEEHSTLQEVELISEDEAAAEKEKEKEKPEEPAEPAEKMEAETEEPPDAAEMLQNLELSAAAAAPALDAASLSAIEAALNGTGGGASDFADALNFNSGGRIGGMAKAGELDEKTEGAFSLDEIDQKPRAIFQAAAVYPAAMRGKKLEGVVTIIFVVDPAGKVGSPHVEKSTNAVFDKPAIDALKRWKFEPAIKGGQRVSCKMRVPIRFQPS